MLLEDDDILLPGEDDVVHLIPSMSDVASLLTLCGFSDDGDWYDDNAEAVTCADCLSLMGYLDDLLGSELDF